MKGVDISHYQKGLTVQQIKNSGNAFAVIKLTEGTWLVDAAAFDFYRNAYEIGFPVGCYCYSHAVTEEQARAEAAFLLKTINGFPMPCGIFLDVEEPKLLELKHDELKAAVLAWCGAIREAGYTPGVYGSEYSLWAKLRPDELPADALVWVAHYGKAPDVPCDLWQSSDSGRVEGYTGPVDTDEVRSSRFKEIVEAGMPKKGQPGIRPPESPDASVMILQMLLAYNGCDIPVNGKRSEGFFESLRAFVSALEDSA